MHCSRIGQTTCFKLRAHGRHPALTAELVWCGSTVVLDLLGNSEETCWIFVASLRLLCRLNSIHNVQQYCTGDPFLCGPWCDPKPTSAFNESQFDLLHCRLSIRVTDNCNSPTNAQRGSFNHYSGLLCLTGRIPRTQFLVYPALNELGHRCMWIYLRQMGTKQSEVAFSFHALQLWNKHPENMVS